MTRKYVQPGEVMDYTAAGNIASGDVVLIGKRIGVALKDIAIGTVGSVQVSGVFELNKLSTDVVAAGDELYWDAGNSRLTLTDTANTLAGYAFAPAGNGVTAVKIKLNA